MGKEKKAKKSTMEPRKLGSKSQLARLNKIVAATYRIVGVGILLLIAYTAITILVSRENAKQLENTMYLNQYRLGSKTLTAEVQSFAVTGEELHYNNYMKELNTDKNRDIAWAGLKENGLTDDEWAALEHIASLSNGLVPLEEQSMEYAKNGQIGDFFTGFAHIGVKYYEATGKQVKFYPIYIDKKKRQFIIGKGIEFDCKNDRSLEKKRLADELRNSMENLRTF